MSTATPTEHLTIKRGSTVARLYQVRTGTSVPDITTWAIWFTAKRDASADITDADAVFQLGIGTGVEIVSGAGGTFRVTIPASATDEMTKSEKLVYDVKAIDDDSEPRDLVCGNLTVEMNVGRRVA